MIPRLIATAALAAALATSAHAAAKVGEKAPDFTLPSVTGKEIKLSDLQGKVVVLEWTNHECPFVRKFYDGGHMQELQGKWTKSDVVWLQVVSSAEGKQGYVNAESGKTLWTDKKMASTDMLLDPSGEVGKAYGAKTTPHMFVIDKEGTLVYAGAIDSDATTEYNKDATNYTDAALTAVMAGKPVETASTKPYGCSVKYAD